MQSDLANCWFSVKSEVGVEKERESPRFHPIWYQPHVPCGPWYAALHVLLCVAVESGRRWKVTRGALHVGRLVCVVRTWSHTTSLLPTYFKFLSSECVSCLRLISNQILGYNV